ncbi:tetratricopeptide repeat protein [Yinghuangia soli]|uniref:Tetratricopeptide repeat protein n=1 Tax=Yinghuangia soli TaxID=2908204 RepID=A0AA41TYK1_9ACTN|nr:tetratricopeptide repeat protein [Yinghuangia soli]MCF2527893.1 tetratricopeptide repeat protein [Yinghuangia soli]
MKWFRTQPRQGAVFWRRLREAEQHLQGRRFAESLAMLDWVIVEGSGRYLPPFGECMGQVHVCRLFALAELGRAPEAWEHFSSVMPGFLATGPQAGDSVRALRAMMGQILLRHGHDDAAQEHFALVLAECQATGNSAEALAWNVKFVGYEVVTGRAEAGERRARVVLPQLDAVQMAEEDRKKSTGLVRGLLAIALAESGRPDEGVREAESAVAELTGLHGSDCDCADLARRIRAFALVESGRADEAEAELRTMLAAFDTEDHAGRTQLGSLRSVLGQALVAQGRHAEAVAELRPAIPLLSSTQGSGAPVTLDAASVLARALQASGEPAEAREILSAALQAGESGPDRGHPEVARIRERLAAL